jgi:hypothetical protein
LGSAGGFWEVGSFSGSFAGALSSPQPAKASREQIIAIARTKAKIFFIFFASFSIDF